MKLHLRLAATTAALFSLSQPALAQGAQCIEPADLADATTYTMPLLVEAAQTRCSDVLASDSYMLTEGTEFAGRFAPLRDEAWPGTQRVLGAFIEDRTGASREMAAKADPAMGGMIVNLLRESGDEMRPFVDAMVMQIVAEEMKPRSCNDLDRLVRLLAPLPPENWGQLVATVMGMVEPDSPAVCAVPD